MTRFFPEMETALMEVVVVCMTRTLPCPIATLAYNMLSKLWQKCCRRMKCQWETMKKRRHMKLLKTLMIGGTVLWSKD